MFSTRKIGVLPSKYTRDKVGSLITSPCVSIPEPGVAHRSPAATLEPHHPRRQMSDQHLPAWPPPGSQTSRQGLPRSRGRRRKRISTLIALFLILCTFIAVGDSLHRRPRAAPIQNPERLFAQLVERVNLVVALAVGA